MGREKIKTLILICLVLMSIVFTQKIWFEYPIKGLYSRLQVEEKDVSVVDIRKELVIPSRGIINFGNNNYTTISSDIEKLWKNISGVLSLYFQGEPLINSIAYEDYRKNARIRSIELEFGENISSVLIASVFDTLDNNLVNSIKDINKILIPIGNKDIIYIMSDEETYYELILEDSGANRSLAGYIDDIRGGRHVKYYPLFADIDNYTVMPLSIEDEVPLVFVESQIDIKDEDLVTERARGFFDESLDFVKTIKETSGALVFMYGYGEKGVRINNRGRLEFNQEIGEEFSTNVVTAMDVAIDFVMKHGGFPEDTYLREIRHMDGGGYYFAFEYRMRGLALIFNNPALNHAIEVEVYGNKVKRFASFIRKGMTLPDVVTNRDIILPHRIIENNIGLLIEDHLMDMEEENFIGDIDILTSMEQNINKVELVYYDTLEESRRQVLTPAWKIQIGKRLYYFDSYSGKLLYDGLVS